LPRPRLTETENAVDAVRKQALDMLARREHSGAELRAKLTAKGFPSDIIRAALMELRRSGWLDDSRFAEAFIRARSDRGYGPARIRAELKERGVDDEVISSHLNAHDPSWIRRVRGVWNKRFAAKQPGSYAEKARQMRFLQSRGFTVEQIRSVLDGGVDEE
jgi:regulatory protein